MPDIVFQVFLIAFGAVVLLLLAIGGALDMAARIEYAQGVFPPLKKWAESRKWQHV